jgi:hypothetical protein
MPGRKNAEHADGPAGSVEPSGGRDRTAHANVPRLTACSVRGLRRRWNVGLDGPSWAATVPPGPDQSSTRTAVVSRAGRYPHQGGIPARAASRPGRHPGQDGIQTKLCREDGSVRRRSEGATGQVSPPSSRRGEICRDAAARRPADRCTTHIRGAGIGRDVRLHPTDGGVFNQDGSSLSIDHRPRGARTQGGGQPLHR